MTLEDEYTSNCSESSSENGFESGSLENLTLTLKESLEFADMLDKSFKFV